MSYINPEAGGGLLRFTTAGSVDDGKSSLIGRLLYDSNAVPTDQVAALRRHADRLGETDIDLSLLTDGLRAERERGITIDVAYRYFATSRRKFIIADSPGHEQYTRNMVTGASTAEAAVILIDARKGMTVQTRRHLYLSVLLGISHLVVAINKMDLVEFDRRIFERLAAEAPRFAAALGGPAPVALPLSAKHGDNVVRRSRHTAWYAGPPLLAHLEELPQGGRAWDRPFRMPVQLVQRIYGPHGPRRRYLGRIESGTVAIGDDVSVFPGSGRTRVTSLTLPAGDAPAATAPFSVAVEVADDIDISRGDVLALNATPARARQSFEAMLCWLSDGTFDPARRYLLKSATRTTAARLPRVIARIDVSHLSETSSPSSLRANDIARVEVTTAAAVAYDTYAENRSTGSFILIDELTNETAAAGMIQASEIDIARQ